MGRPTLYKPEYCEALITHMTGGLSYESFAGTVEVSRKTLNAWEKAHPEFNEAKEIGKSKSLLWWEQRGIDGLAEKFFNATVWIFAMKNRHGWRNEQPETPPDGDGKDAKPKLTPSEWAEHLKARGKAKEGSK